MMCDESWRCLPLVEPYDPHISLSALRRAAPRSERFHRRIAAQKLKRSTINRFALFRRGKPVSSPQNYPAPGRRTGCKLLSSING